MARAGRRSRNAEALPEQLSVRALHVCERAGMKSVDQLPRYCRKHEAFSALQGCGKKTERELMAFCRDRGVVPVKEAKQDSRTEAAGTLEGYSGFPVRYVKTYLGPHLLKTLRMAGIRTVGELGNIDSETFPAKRKLRRRAAERLRDLMHDMVDRPERVVRTMEKQPSGVVLPEAARRKSALLDAGDFLGAFEAVALSYVALHGHAEKRRKLRWVLGLHGARMLTTVAEKFGTTGESIRQIESRSMEDVSLLLGGEELRKPLCTCDPDYRQLIVTRMDALKPHLVVDYRHMVRRVKEITGRRMSKRREGLLVFLMELWGMRTITRGEQRFVLRGEISSARLGRAVQTVSDVMSGEVTAISVSELAREVNRRLPRARMTVEAVGEVAEIVPAVEKRGEGHYQRTLGSLCRRDRIYRVLQEHGEPLEYETLRDRLQAMEVACGTPTGATVRWLREALNSDRRIVAIKYGVYGLREWGLKSVSAPLVEGPRLYALMQEIAGPRGRKGIEAGALFDELRKRGVDWRRSAFYMRMQNTKYIRKMRKGSKVYYAVRKGRGAKAGVNTREKRRAKAGPP